MKYVNFLALKMWKKNEDVYNSNVLYSSKNVYAIENKYIYEVIFGESFQM